MTTGTDEFPSIPAAEIPLVTIADIRAAAVSLAGVTVRTPLLPFGRPIAGHPLGHPRLWLKAELLQPIGAFKLRGAFHALASLTPEERARGVVTHSSGNHAQGVARAALILGIRAVVVMPSDAPAIKVAGVRADGAEVVSVGTSSDERVRVSEALARDQGLVLIPAYDDARIIAGQGSCGLEIVEQLAELGYGSTPFTVLAPIGGGGLAAGVSVAVKTLRPDARVFGVEPEVAADAAESLRVGHVVRWDADRVGRTAADGMRTSALGALTFRHLSALADGVLTVSEIDIRRAMVRAARQARLVVEPSGATSLAAWLAHEAELPPDGPVVAILSGGNTDAERYAELMSEGLAAGG